MLPRLLRPLALSAVIAAATALGSIPLAAQRPSAQEAQELLRTRPDLVAQLRQRFAQSGLTREQVRARLRAAGYPEDMLDGYLVEFTPTDSGARAAGPADVVAELAVTDTGSDSVRRERRPGTGSDSLPTAGAADSLASALAAVFQPKPQTGADGRAIFGLDLFRRSTSQFDANLAGPVDATYRLGPGDRLVLILTGDVELAHALDVTREGFIVVPQVGQLPVANLTLGQVESTLLTRLARLYPGIGRGPGARTQVALSISRLRTNQVYVVGDATAPGSYRVSSAGTALSALYAAGGPTENGNLRRIEVRRGNQSVATLDLYDYLLRGDASRDVRLENGDVIFVPVHGPRVRVVGEVVRPATYELKSGESLADAITAAGGFTERALRSRVQVERIVPPQKRVPGGPERVIIDVTADQLASTDGAPTVEPGDVIRVSPVVNDVRDRIMVRGEVWHPGPQGFAPGMRLSDALRRAGGVRPGAYLGQVLVDRLQPDSSRVQLRAVLRDTTGAAIDDIALQERDEIQVSSTAEFRPQQWVSIGGAVQKGGRFPYREGMTLRSLVQLAGGLDEGALLDWAEVARLPDDRSDGATAKAFRVRMDSTYLFESGAPVAAAARPEVVLEPYDNVMIARQPGWELQRVVVLSGEVRYPGRYALLSKSERLVDVIARAGGLTREAYADGIIFDRKANRVGRIGVDLSAALASRSHRDNLLLADGDSVHVPRFNAVIDVRGAVHSPLAVAYVPGRDLADYVNAAGGSTASADFKRSYVVQPNGKVEAVKRRRLLPDGMPIPRPGGVVVVPEKLATDKRDVASTVAVSAQALTAVVGIIALLRR